MAGVPRLDPRLQIKRQLIQAASPVPSDDQLQKEYERDSQQRTKPVDTYGGARASQQEAVDRAKALVRSVMPKIDTERAASVGRDEGERSAAVARLRANRQQIAAQRAQKKAPKHEEFIGDTPVAYSTRWTPEKKERAAPDYANMPKLSKNDVAGHLATALKEVPRGSYGDDEKFHKDLYQLGRSVLSNAPESRDLSESDKNEIAMSAIQKLRTDPNYGAKPPKNDDQELGGMIKKDLRQKKKDRIVEKRAQRTAKHDLAAAAAELTGKPQRKHRATKELDYANWEDPNSGVYKGRKLRYAKALKRAKDSGGDYSRADALAAGSGLNPKTIARVKNHIVNGVTPGTRKRKGPASTEWTQSRRAAFFEKVQEQGYSLEEARAMTERAAKSGSTAGHAKLAAQLRRQGYADDDAEKMASEFEQDGLASKKPKEPKPFAKKGTYKFKKGR